MPEEARQPDRDPEDRKLIRAYLDHLKAQGLSTGRLYKIAWTLVDIRKRLASRTSKAALEKTSSHLVLYNFSRSSALALSPPCRVLTISESGILYSPKGAPRP